MVEEGPPEAEGTQDSERVEIILPDREDRDLPSWAVHMFVSGGTDTILTTLSLTLGTLKCRKPG